MSELGDNGLIDSLGSFLNHSQIVDDYALVDELSDQTELTLMMGQTFDDGQPVDLLKYGLLLQGVQDLAQQRGIRTNAIWLIADHFISDINQEQQTAIVNKQAQDRIAFLNKLNTVFGLNIGHVLSSELAQSPDYKQKLERLTQEHVDNPEFSEAVLLAVPEDRRADPKSARYPIEEIATISSLGTDIKVGPVYERKYDDPTRNIASKIGFKVFASIYGTRAFLFGSPELDEDVRLSVEEFGILPYKIDSKGQRDYRIDPINDDPDAVEKLIYETKDGRALLDLIAISALARQRLQIEPEGEQQNPLNCIDNRQLKKMAYNAYLCYIYGPLTSVVN